MRADDEIDRAVFEAGQRVASLAALFAAGQDREAQSDTLRQRRNGRQMLARQDFRRRHQRRLAAGLHRARHGEQRHHGLAGADIALQQAQHAFWLGEVVLDFDQRLFLAACQRIGQRRRSFSISLPSPVSGRPAARRTLARTNASAICPARNSS